jgi:hypothetical protein
MLRTSVRRASHELGRPFGLADGVPPSEKGDRPPATSRGTPQPGWAAETKMVRAAGLEPARRLPSNGF